MSDAAIHPTPVRFSADEEAVLAACVKITGMSKSEIIRRAVRLLAREFKRTGRADFIFPLVDTWPEPAQFSYVEPSVAALRVAESAASPDPPGKSAGTIAHPSPQPHVTYPRPAKRARK